MATMSSLLRRQFLDATPHRGTPRRGTPSQGLGRGVVWLAGGAAVYAGALAGISMAGAAGPGGVPDLAARPLELGDDLRIGGSPDEPGDPWVGDELADPYAGQPIAQARPGHVLFLNFGGSPNVRVALSSLPAKPNPLENSATDTTTVDNCGGAYPAYNGASQAAAVLAAVKKDFAPYNVNVVDKRPAGGDYTMVLVGPKSGCCGGAGIAGLYCAGITWKATAFGCFGAEVPAVPAAAVISQEAAHTWGLLHVSNNADIMRPAQDNSDPSFTDTCNTPMLAQYCTGQRSACPDGGQNSHRQMLAFFGPNGGKDVESPSVRITFPTPGQKIKTGSTFEVRVEANDNVALSLVELAANGNNLGSDTSVPYGWPAQKVPAGEYKFQARAVDLSGNEKLSDVVTVTVADDGEVIGSAGGTSTTTGGDSGTAGSGTVGSGTVGSGTGDSGTRGGPGGSSSDPSTGGSASVGPGTASGSTVGQQVTAGTASMGSATVAPTGETAMETAGIEPGGTGCGCGATPAVGAWWLLGLVGLGLRRSSGLSARRPATFAGTRAG